MIDRGAFLMGWHTGQLIRVLRNKSEDPRYDVGYENGILYIRKAPAVLVGTVLSLAASDVTGNANTGG